MGDAARLRPRRLARSDHPWTLAAETNSLWSIIRMARCKYIFRVQVILLLGALAKASSHLPDLLPADDADGLSKLAVSTYQEHCPPCEELFTKLETLQDGSRRQETHLQLRGEPKSGTTFMFSWACGILAHTCEYLQDTYGSKSCHTKGGHRQLTMIFEPKLGSSDARCSCNTVERVEMVIMEADKHTFPVEPSCRWFHRNGIPNEGEGCWTVGGRAVENAHDVWGCMQEASCAITDDRPQYVAIRDPRAVAVSTHFYVRANPTKYTKDHFAQNHTLDETVMKILPQVCHLTTLRHILFSGIMPDRSEIFWYDDALQNPSDWHHRWMSLAGLFLPRPWVESIVSSAGKGKWSTEVNPHPGGEKASVNRTWRDEVSPEILDDMDDILRTWLPGVLLARFNVPL